MADRSGKATSGDPSGRGTVAGFKVPFPARMGPYSEEQINTVVEVMRNAECQTQGDHMRKFEADFKGHTATISSSVLDRLGKNGLVSDEDFAKWWVDQRIRNGQKGWMLIQSELVQKGVSKEIIDSVRISEAEERRLVRSAYDKVCRRKGLSRERCIRRLQSRGFTWDQIRGVLPDE